MFSASCWGYPNPTLVLETGFLQASALSRSLTFSLSMTVTHWPLQPLVIEASLVPDFFHPRILQEPEVLRLNSCHWTLAFTPALWIAWGCLDLVCCPFLYILHPLPCCWDCLQPPDHPGPCLIPGLGIFGTVGQSLFNHSWCLGGLSKIVYNWSKSVEAFAPYLVEVMWGTQPFSYQFEHLITWRQTTENYTLHSKGTYKWLLDRVGSIKIKLIQIMIWITSQEESIKSILSLQKCIRFWYNFNAQPSQLWQR